MTILGCCKGNGLAEPGKFSPFSRSFKLARLVIVLVIMLDGTVRIT